MTPIYYTWKDHDVFDMSLCYMSLWNWSWYILHVAREWNDLKSK